MALQGTGNFTPKQLSILTAQELQELQSDVSEQIIRETITQLPPIPPNAVIHDNACGAGAVTSEILNLNPPPENVKIMATDINEHFVQGVTELAKSKEWPVTASVQDIRALHFPNEYFDYSYASIAMHCIGNPIQAASEMYRTLKKGGNMAASVWADMPHADAIHEAHWAIRGRDAPVPPLLPLIAYRGEELRADLIAGGFEESKIKIVQEDAILSVKDLDRWAQLAWSYLGWGENGWQPEDEEKWEQAVSVVADKLKKGRNTSRGPNGEVVVKMVADVAIVSK